MSCWKSLLTVAGWSLFLSAGAAQQVEKGKPDPAAVQFFENKVRPLLVDHCQKCHGSKKQEGGLRLDSSLAVKKGGDSGLVVLPGKPKESLLIRAVNHDGLKMPPKEKLKPEQLAVLTEWVRLGALWPETQGVQVAVMDIAGARKTNWAFKPVNVQAPPPGGGAWGQNSIDAFVFEKLQARGLTPVEPADQRTLIRRATFDLLGLPPTPEEVAAALDDSSPNWFEKVVERLLASPHYGERWGRHWLDLVRYADTAGDNSDYPVPQLHKYRNWVIDAFNKDKPYDAFLREQLAGDLLPHASEQDRQEKFIATGYLANARRIGSYEDARYPWHLTIEDTIDNLGRTVLGLTINCCRCHDHKFDPLTNEDYYALYGFFSSTRYPWPGIELDKVPKDLVALASASEIERVQQERQAKLAPVDANLKRLEKDKTDTEESLQAAEKLPADEGRAARIAGLKKHLEGVTKTIAAARKDREAEERRPLPYETAYAVVDGRNEPKKRIGIVGNARVQLKGDPERPGKEVPRHFPLVLGGQTLPADARGSGRLQLADWLTEPSNPLTARVMVNRLWQYHFGKGIVPTPSDFGKQGQPATHPELLDYLAGRFSENGWSIKKLHRLIMLSRTYQLASSDREGNLKKDANNDYRWRFGRRRLDAESIRDAMLAISGTLDRTPGGPHPFAPQSAWNYTQHNPFKAVYESNRRSVYLMTQRIQRHPYLALFDGPDTNASTASRVTSTTPLQALFLMNDPFVHEQSKKLAARLLAERSDDGQRIERAYLLLFGRAPTAEERTASEGYLSRVREKLGSAAGQQSAREWESYVRVLFMTNEFIYVN